MKGRGKPVDQQHRPAQFPHDKIRERPRRECNPNRIGGRRDYVSAAFSRARDVSPEAAGPRKDRPTWLKWRAIGRNNTSHDPMEELAQDGRRERDPTPTLTKGRASRLVDWPRRTILVRKSIRDRIYDRRRKLLHHSSSELDWRSAAIIDKYRRIGYRIMKFRWCNTFTLELGSFDLGSGKMFVQTGITSLLARSCMRDVALDTPGPREPSGVHIPPSAGKAVSPDTQYPRPYEPGETAERKTTPGQQHKYVRDSHAGGDNVSDPAYCLRRHSSCWVVCGGRVPSISLVKSRIPTAGGGSRARRLRYTLAALLSLGRDTDHKQMRAKNTLEGRVSNHSETGGSVEGERERLTKGMDSVLVAGRSPARRMKCPSKEGRFWNHPGQCKLVPILRPEADIAYRDSSCRATRHRQRERPVVPRKSVIAGRQAGRQAGSSAVTHVAHAPSGSRGQLALIQPGSQVATGPIAAGSIPSSCVPTHALHLIVASGLPACLQLSSDCSWSDLSPPAKANRVRFPAQLLPGFSHVVIMPDDASGQRFFSGSSVSLALSFQLSGRLSTPR
ncbi:hypothetical protein PR048_005065 [Dryococelus australis]|uniref:Uncharacterized protein n=1 Tax=Dryococelus australis TaxID=614101 RepID=A0ABQ9I752_9NEOP|nr:hypothetical protein PR048_005065 [Dryococelus australis]